MEKMRIVVLGAGAIGGYFGARLLAAGRDVHFIVREKRAAALGAHGLTVTSSHGDLHLPAPPVIAAGTGAAAADIVILSCKAYDLDSALEAIAPVVGPQTMILPLLNGMAHLERIAARFGEGAVLGGQCVIAVTMDEAGTIRHLNDMHVLTFGERAGGFSPRVEAAREALSGAGFNVNASASIMLEMWEKWVFLASLAAATSLMRAPVGDIVGAEGGKTFMAGMVAECTAVATAAGYPPREEVSARIMAGMLAENSLLTASLLRDIQRGSRSEGDQIIGDLVHRAHVAGLAVPLLETARLHLAAYERQRVRLAAG